MVEIVLARRLVVLVVAYVPVLVLGLGLVVLLLVRVDGVTVPIMVNVLEALLVERDAEVGSIFVAVNVLEKVTWVVVVCVCGADLVNVLVVLHGW